MKKALGISLMFLFLLRVLPFSFSQAQETAYQSLISGMENYRDGNYQKALKDFFEAEKLFPQDPDIPFYIGLTYLELNQREKAIAYFQKALKLNPRYLDARFQLGMGLIQEGKFKQALSHLRKVFKQQPDKENLGYFLGYSYFNLGNFRKALHYFERNRTQDREIEQLNLYYSGLAKTYLGRVEEAEELYQRVIEIAPLSPLAQPSKQLLAIRPIVPEEKRLSFELTTRFQYDDNLILVPTTNVYRLRERDRETFIKLLYLRGEYSFLRTPYSQFLASYGFYQTICFALRDNDVQNHILSLDWLYSDRKETFPHKSFRFTYSYDHLLLDYNSFLYRHTLRPILIIETPRNVTLLQYTFQDKTFKEKPLFREDRRDAQNHEIGFVHFLRFSEGRHFLKAGYFYDREFAQGDNWDYQGNRGIIGFQYTLPKDIRLNLDYNYKNVGYEDENIFFDKHRKDIARDLTLGLSKDIGENKTISLEYTRTINSSNIALYDYEKNLVSVGMDWRW